MECESNEKLLQLLQQKQIQEARAVLEQDLALLHSWDLSNFNLRGVDLSGVDLSDTNICGADLREVNYGKESQPASKNVVSTLIGKLELSLEEALRCPFTAESWWTQGKQTKYVRNPSRYSTNV